MREFMQKETALTVSATWVQAARSNCSSARFEQVYQVCVNRNVGNAIHHPSRCMRTFSSREGLSFPLCSPGHWRPRAASAQGRPGAPRTVPGKREAPCPLSFPFLGGGVAKLCNITVVPTFGVTENLGLGVPVKPYLGQVFTPSFLPS